MLVDPKPSSLRNLKPWRKFRADVAQLSVAELKAIADRLCLDQTDYPPLVKGVRQQLAAAHNDDDLARELVRIALWLGNLTAYASSPTKGKAFAIAPQVWDAMALGYHDAHRSIDDGIFAIDPAKYRVNTIERELANRPIFINGSLANDWLRVKPSRVQQSKTAKAIIKSYKDQNPGPRMRKADFVTAVVDQLPGLSPNRAMQLWGDNAPAAWKRPGTKKGH